MSVDMNDGRRQSDVSKSALYRLSREGNVLLYRAS
jgi:hypothetical protein